MDYQNILTKQNDGVLLITINRPRNLNALNHSTILELNHAFLNAEKSKNIKCLILTGTGKQSFIAGADIKEFSTFNQKKDPILISPIGRAAVIIFIQKF